jgi:hypothetical protein
MALSLVAVGAKITAAITNAITNAVNAGGTALVPPTSVAGTGVAMTSLGKVTLTAATTASLNGVFTGAYDNYLIVCNLTLSVSGLLKMVFRASGTDNVTANYAYQAVQGAGSTASAGGITGQTGTFLSNQAGTQIDARTDVFAPALAAITRYWSEFYAVAGVQVAGAIAGELASATAVDGFTVTPGSGGTMTGTIRVYGYNNG